MKRIAVIDQGTNSTKVFVFEMGKSGLPNEIFKGIAETRLGSGIKQTGLVTKQKLQEMIDVLKDFNFKFEEMNVDKVELISTEVLRKAKNVDEVLSEIDKQLGWQVRILTHVQEMELFWYGVVADFDWDKQIAAIDIGGGTVQFMWGTKEGLEGFKLLKTGVLGLREKYIKDDPATEDEYYQIEKDIRAHLEDLKVTFNSDVPFIHGTTSVIDFYQEAGMEMDKFNFSKSHSYKVGLNQTKELYLKNRLLPRVERVKLFPSHPDFVDGAWIGLANVLLIAEKTGLKYELPSNNNYIHGVVRLMMEDNLEEFLS